MYRNRNAIINYSLVDECSTNVHNCDSNAVCSDTDDSYSCDCVVGYVGDGFTCSGKLLNEDNYII